MKQITLIIIGTLCIALGTTLLAIPNQLADGGVIGISLLLYYAFDFSPGILLFISFVVLIGVSVKYLPRHMVYKSLINVPLLSLLIFLTEGLGQPLGDPLVAAIFAGVIIGSGFGLIIQAGSSIGGTSIIGLMFNQKFGWDVVLVTFVLDILIVLAGVFIIGPLYMMYTVVALFVGKIASDYVLSGFDAKKAVNIISTRSIDISKRITTDMASSATVFEGYGGYSGEDKKSVYVVVRSPRILSLKRLIREIDPDAFVVVHNVKDVSGGTFFATPSMDEKVEIEDDFYDYEGI